MEILEVYAQVVLLVIATLPLSPLNTDKLESSSSKGPI